MFKEFLPGDNDSVYPNTPLAVEEWSRKNVYLAALAGNQNDQMLLVESDRLNTWLNVAMTANTINFSQYHYPDFNPQDPMKSKN